MNRPFHTEGEAETACGGALLLPKARLRVPEALPVAAGTLPASDALILPKARLKAPVAPKLKVPVAQIGILALQGAVREHRAMLHSLGVEAVDVLAPGDLHGIDGLVIPGGESTTVGKLLVRYKLLEPIAALGRKGLPIFGTCTGLILLSKHINNSDQHRLSLMDTHVERNAFGRQAASFEADMSIPVLGEKPYHTIFIRAPFIESADPNVTVLLRHEGKILLAEQDNFLACAFHPELTSDPRLHEYFLRHGRFSP